MPYAKYKGHRQRHFRGGKRVIGVPQDEHSATEAFGLEFPRGYWVPLDGVADAHVKKLQANPGFVVQDKPERNEPVLKPGEVVRTGVQAIQTADPWADAIDLDASRGGQQSDEAEGAV